VEWELGCPAGGGRGGAIEKREAARYCLEKEKVFCQWDMENAFLGCQPWKCRKGVLPWQGVVGGEKKKRKVVFEEPSS